MALIKFLHLHNTIMYDFTKPKRDRWFTRGVRRTLSDTLVGGLHHSILPEVVYHSVFFFL